MTPNGRFFNCGPHLFVCLVYIARIVWAWSFFRQKSGLNEILNFWALSKINMTFTTMSPVDVRQVTVSFQSVLDVTLVEILLRAHCCFEVLFTHAHCGSLLKESRKSGVYIVAVSSYVKGASYVPYAEVYRTCNH